MEIFGKSVKFSLSKMVLLALFVAIVVSVVIYFLVDKPSSKWGALFGSLAAGLVVASIQFLISWQDYKQSEKLQELKLKEVLYNRAITGRYEEYIKKTNRELDIMGVTTVRFFRDFADTSIGAPENAKVLIDAMNRGVKVRILIPANNYIPKEKEPFAEEVRKKYEDLRKLFNQMIEIRYFTHNAAHSIFRTDDICIIGPVFPNLESRNTPALRMMKSSKMALTYMDYFEYEWNKAGKQEHA